VSDKVTQVFYEPDEEQMQNNRESALSGYQNMPRTGTKNDSIKENTNENESNSVLHPEEVSSATDADMDEILVNSNVDRRTKKVIHRNMKNWNDKI
jgi:hypothetical protein